MAIAGCRASPLEAVQLSEGRTTHPIERDPAKSADEEVRRGAPEGRSGRQLRSVRGRRSTQPSAAEAKAIVRGYCAEFRERTRLREFELPSTREPEGLSAGKKSQKEILDVARETKLGVVTEIEQFGLMYKCRGTTSQH